ncbi:MAG: HAD family hydrolase [Plesiomonas sp.]|uniref:HAD family hydrolase n=1 Tax=Plesiomonas sp. TaxID=2486279 RepID=UPI003F3A9B8C
MALALFDLDETLLAGDSASLWLAYMVEHGLAEPELLLKEQALMAEYHQGTLDMAHYMAITLQPLVGRTRKWLNTHCQHFANQQLKSRLYADGIARVNWHQLRGDTVVLISASGEHLVSPVARILGIDHCVAILLDEQAGVLTGNTCGTFSFRQGKVARIDQLAASLWPNNPDVWADSYGYSDSHNDLPMLHAVEHPYVINPSKVLQQVAKEQCWPTLTWQAC